MRENFIVNQLLNYKINIGGIAPFTTIDFPGALAAVLFCQGCPWRCPYCHNPHLQQVKRKAVHPWPEVIAFLEERKHFLDAVVFSGGEPTLQKDLPVAIQSVRALGYRVGLHTNGMFPDVLTAILPLIDWVGLDIKAPLSRYDTITKVKQSHIGIEKSIDAVIQSGVAYEFRTTVHPDLLNSDDLLQLAHEIAKKGAKHFVLQRFRSEGSALQEPFQWTFDESILPLIQGLFQTFLVRD